MLRNYFLIALRNFQRHKSFTIINVLGLALGIACALLIFLLVDLHTSFDTYHQNADNTYRLTSDLHFEQTIQTPGVPYPMPSMVKTEIPQVDKLATYYEMGGILATVEENGEKKKFQNEDLSGAYVEPVFFEIFDYKWLVGNPAALADPNKMVLTEKTAKLLFGDKDPIGRQVKIDNDENFIVVGLLGDLPENTDLNEEVYCSYITLAQSPDMKEKMERWGGVNSSHQCYITLVDNASPGEVEKTLLAFNDKYHPDTKDEIPNGNAWETKLQPLLDIHFNTDYGGGADKSLIWALSLVGLLMIGTACINFINIATAQALNRSKEVGIRKVIGGSRWQLFRQFMMETGVIVFLAILFAVAIVKPVLPYMSDLVESELTFNLMENSSLWLLLLGVFAGVTFLSGTYPALVLAGFQPALAVKGKITTQTLGGFNVRRSLVVLQFTISQLLIISAIVMTCQLNYMKKSDMGFNQDAIVVLELPEKDGKKMQTLKNRLLEIPGVEQLSYSQTAPASGSMNNTNFSYDGRQEDEKWFITTRPSDAEFLDIYDIELLAGRNLQPSDTTTGYLINEEVVKKLELASPEEAIGKELVVWGSPAPIVGVVKNYFTASVSRGIYPLAIMCRQKNYRTANLKISTADVPKTLAAIEKTWNGMYPEHFYDYQFLDEAIVEFYQLESILLTLIRTFCGIAIFIGCLGLYGLVTFLVARRLKEIGVRKVLGASIANILGIFGKEFMRLILIAFVFAAPLGYFAMNAFLQDYAHAIKLGAWMFITAILMTGLIAAVTIGWQSWQAAKLNPAEVLKAE